MRRFILTLGIAGLMLAWASCGPVPLAQYGARRFLREGRGLRLDAFAAMPLTRDVRSYRWLAVEPLQNQMEDRIPAELVAALDQQLFQHLQRVKRLEVLRARPPQDRESQDADHAPDSSQAPALEGAEGRPQPGLPLDGAATLILQGAIVDFDAGRQSMRVLQVGVGRQAVLTLHLWLLDGGSGEVLAKYVINSEVYRLSSDSRAGVAKLSRGIGELVAQLVQKENTASAATGSRSQSGSSGNR